MRRDYSVESSEVYMLCPRQLRSLGLELLQRNRDNAYRSHPEHKQLSADERAALYDRLKAKIEREGFRPDMPITIMLLRDDKADDRAKDKILQGHHRLSIAIELGLPAVPVRFVH
jgi:hypothetical protein